MKVSAYCRVSTDHEDQANSLESQQKYFREYINRQPEWELVKIYVDEGITGTNIKKREAFKEMLKDAENKKFDLLLTKEISRFARNTLDSIQYTRKLKSLGIGVTFINDNINTLDADSELRLTIMASIAQEESRKTSSRVKWGIKRKMERGFVWGNHCYGYNLNNGIITINEEEAKIIRLIFQMYYDGAGTLKIKKALEDMGIISPTGLHSWKKSSILSMLKNEKYMGTLKQRKEIVVDYLTHEKKKNDGEKEEFIIIENHHEPIIEPEFFNKIQAEITRRSKMTNDKAKYSNQYAFSGKIKCALCGASFHRKYWNGKHEEKNAVWQCSTNIYRGRVKPDPYDPDNTIGCDCKGIHEVILQEAFLQAASSILNDTATVIKSVKLVVQEVLTTAGQHDSELTDILNSISKIEKKKQRLMELFMEGDINKGEFRESKVLYDKQLTQLESRRSEIEYSKESAKKLEERLLTIYTLIDKLGNLREFGDEVCKELLVKIIVYSRDHIDFFLGIDASLFIPVLEGSHQLHR